MTPAIIITDNVDHAGERDILPVYVFYMLEPTSARSHRHAKAKLLSIAWIFIPLIDIQSLQRGLECLKAKGSTWL